MALSCNAPTLVYWLDAPGIHELKSAGNADTLLWAFRTVSWGFSLLTGGQIMSMNVVCILRHQFLNATRVSQVARQGYRILVLRWERDLRRCSPSRSAVCSSLNTSMHNPHTKLWAEVMYHPQMLLALHPRYLPHWNAWVLWQLMGSNVWLFSGYKLRAEWLINCMSMTAAFALFNNCLSQMPD